MIPGETWKAPKGVPVMTLVVISKDGEFMQSGVDPAWNVLEHTQKNGSGWTFIKSLRIGSTISHVPCRPSDARYVVRLLNKRRKLRGFLDVYSPAALVLTPEGADDFYVRQARHWPFGSRVSIWDLIRHPQL